MNPLTAQTFRPYGRLIEYPGKNRKGKKRNLWRIVLKEPDRFGWRIAYLVLRDKTLRRLEKHPHTYESFEPVKGKSLIFVSLNRDFKKVKCFRLDKPIILRKGIWHGLISLTSETEIKITENVEVKCVYWLLNKTQTKEFAWKP